MVIDIHAHTSKSPMRGLHTVSANIPTIEQLARNHNIDQVVIMATYFPLKKTGLHNRELLSRIQGKDQFLAFLSLDLTHDIDAGLDEIRKLSNHKQVVGIKLYPGYQNFDPSGPKACRVYGLAEELGLPVALHCGSLHHCCSLEKDDSGLFKCGLSSCPLNKMELLSQPYSFEGGVKKFPKVSFLVSHLGNPYFDQLRDLMQHYPNVSTDISGQFKSGSEEDTSDYREKLISELRKFLQLPNGTKRLLFGTDFPIQSYSDSLDLMRRLKLSPDDYKRVMGQNAKQLLGF